jgi:hypothetical protein
MSLRTLVALTVAALAIAPLGRAAAQTPDKNKPAVGPGQNGPGQLEVPHGPYVPAPRGMARSPGMRATYGRHVAIQTNVDSNGNNIVGDAANEPSLAVDPTNPFRMVIGWRQFDTITSDFRQAGWAYTTDGGEHWHFPGVIEPTHFRSDPVLCANADGVFFYNSLTNEGDYYCKVFRSYNGGQTWDAGTSAYGGDKQWMTVDPTNGIGRGNLYAFWTEYYSTCSTGHFTRSYDDGASFVDCTQIPGSPMWGTFAVGSDGTLYVCGDGFEFAKSTTMQNSSLPAAWQYNTTVSLGGSIVMSAGPNPGGLLGQVWLAVDRSGGPRNGYLYMLCSVDPPGSDPLDVMFSRSTNGGQTWSTPVRVNDDPTTNGAWQWFGTMSIAPNGRLNVIWNDTRNHPGTYLSELFYSHSDDGGVTWSANEQLTTSFDPQIGWPVQNKIGDYSQLISDDRGADLAFAATFNGEEDVYYMRIGEPRCSDAGTIDLDKAKYACTGTATITVVDCDLNTDPNTIQTVLVTIASTSEPAGETVTLTESGAATALFTGSISLSGTNSPGVLWVHAGDTITATYNDADDGSGNPAVVTATAVIDCTPPVISNVHATDLQAHTASVNFNTNEPARGVVHYGLACGALNQTASGSGYSATPTVSLSGLQDNTTYFYRVDAADEAGNSASDLNCYTFTTPEVPDYFTELFSANDMDNLGLSFTPNGSVDFYLGCVGPITQLPTDPTGGTTLSLTDDSYAQVTLTGGATVALYGTTYSTFWVGSNGYITFTSGDSTYTEALDAHFNQPRVSALFDDLDPSQAGTVSWKQLSNRVVVTWLNVTHHSSSNQNTFQIELYFNGQINISFLAIAQADGLAGLSRGTGTPADFMMSDLSGLGPCQATPPTAQVVTASTPQDTPVSVTLKGQDDGLPNPPGLLSYIIVTLPGHGTLADPGAGAITHVPYTLASGGKIVTYAPSLHYFGADAFTFKVNDGGTPPDGGDSNVATATVTVTGVPALLYSWPLDTNPGWTTAGAWAFGHPTGAGSHGRDPNNGHTGTSVYGYNLTGDYTSNLPATYLTTVAINCSQVTQAQLRFWRWLGVEGNADDQRHGLDAGKPEHRDGRGPSADGVRPLGHGSDGQCRDVSGLEHRRRRGVGPGAVRAGRVPGRHEL